MAQHTHHDSGFSIQAPRHPVGQLQSPFEESMLESVHDHTDPDVFLDPITRRNLLLEAPKYTRVVAGRWKQKPGERFHPLWKLVAQLSFGIHLLSEGMAKSEDDVMQILQAHVDEIDGFLERTTEDFDLAQEDISERLRCLKLPLSHPATFDKMLEDRNFRLSIVEGNEKIEHIVERTSQAMKDSLKDVQKGFDSTSCLERYLQDLASQWQRQSIEHEAVFVAMLGNVEGWRKAFTSLHMQGNKLGGHLKKLTDIINEMQARAGEVSRRLLHQARVQHTQVMRRPTGRSSPSTGRSTPTSRFQTTPNKQLPTMPNRPSLRQATSQDTVRTAPSMRNSSQESLRQHVLRGRSQTPQNDMPAPQQVRNGASPRIVQIGATSQARIQSMVPSLLEAVPSPTLPASKPQLVEEDEEEQPERYFPPVELPAHVPEEAMRAVPMSKQNRLSIGLDLQKGIKIEKRNSRLGTSALVDLLRSNPVSEKLSETRRSRSPEVSKRGSTVQSNGIADGSSFQDRAAASSVSHPRLSSINDTTAAHNKNNVRRPNKSAEHWFDAMDDDLDEEGKYSLRENESPQVVVVHSNNQQLDTNSTPGTPSWAKTTFAHVGDRKEMLKKGAFASHPPDRPPGSPPLNQHGQFQNPLAIAGPERKPSHASSAGRSTLGEPGPEVAASDAGTDPGYSGHYHHMTKRASAFAPEVVVQKATPVPRTAKHFIAEMEGDSPVIPGASKYSQDTRAIVMELEAPQQTFWLPPRPPPAKTEIPQEATEQERLPLSGPSQDHLTRHFRVVEERTPQLSGDQAPVQPTIESGKLNDEPTIAVSKKPQNDDEDDDIDEDDDYDIIEQYAVAQTAQVRRLPGKPPSNPTISTPNIPLPESRAETPQSARQEETLFMLPAMAYKPPPISPRLPPDPVLSPAVYRPRPRIVPLPVAEAPLTASPYQDSEPDDEAVTNHQSSDITSAKAAPLSLAPNESAPPSKLSSVEDDYDDPHKATEDINPQSPTIVEPNSALSSMDRNVTKAGNMQRDHKPAELKQPRITSTGSQNGWKAFFTGQPSPIGSNLSIRSMKRESLIDQPKQSPALLSPTSLSSRQRFPPSPLGDNDDSDSVERPPSNERSKENISMPQGLGITTEPSDLR